jgi:hypothetical protein
MAPSPSGKAADCKSAIPGSNPGGASVLLIVPNRQQGENSTDFRPFSLKQILLPSRYKIESLSCYNLFFHRASVELDEEKVVG